MRVPNGLSSGYMVGGKDRTGKTVAGELTEMCLQVISDIRLVYPSVGLCYTEDMPGRIVEKACAILAEGRSHPAFFNDEVISRGLRLYGVPEEESHDYIHSTCVEITPVASSNVWVASPYTNMAQLLLDTMSGEYADFDGHLSEILRRLDLIIQRNFEEQKRLRAYRAEHSLNPLLSCFVNDCLGRGLDIEQGGAKYNWIMPSFVGMANLVDSLFALKTVVYERGELSLCALRQILEENFEGNEPLRLRLLQSLPKYGNDRDEIDRYFGIFTEHIINECKKYEGLHTSARLVPSVFCWIMHEFFGRKTGATPDGRKRGFPLGDGSGPCQGREKSGPTASILSSTKWDHTALIGGVAVNMKFSKNMLGSHLTDVLQSLVRVYMQRGGFELQINVTDRKTLENARKNPEAYRDLVVRIGGYSDYFTRLSAEMQEEIMLRTEHGS
jgi:formate C-acetyltransferase